MPAFSISSTATNFIYEILTVSTALQKRLFHLAPPEMLPSD